MQQQDNYHYTFEELQTYLYSYADLFQQDRVSRLKIKENLEAIKVIFGEYKIWWLPILPTFPKLKLYRAFKKRFFKNKYCNL